MNALAHTPATVGTTVGATVRTLANVARVMICDDSAVIRGALARILESDPEITVVAKVENGKLAESPGMHLACGGKEKLPQSAF